MSVTTIYHTSNKYNEDSELDPNKCVKKQVCNVCEAPFSMDRGCSLEKRCPACRILGLQKPTTFDYEPRMIKIGNEKILRYAPPMCTHRDMMLMNESNLLWFAYKDEEWKYSTDVALDDELLVKLNEVLQQLNEREIKVIKMRFGMKPYMYDLQLEEIANNLGVTRERIRQIESAAIKKLKHPKLGRRLKDYLDGDK